MSVSGTPIEGSIIQAAQAQQVASKARDREKAVSDRTQRFLDAVELRVAGVESAEAVRPLPQNDSEQAEAEHDAAAGRQPSGDASDEDRPHVDLRA